MKNKRKKLIRVLILTLLLQFIPECMKELNIDLTSYVPEEIAGFLEDYTAEEETIVLADQDYGSLFSTDPEIISRINYACSNYGPGSYFSKNGRACTCHGRNINHVNSPSNCNCLRYVKINGSTVDLQSVQCFGYAMYLQMCLFGTTQFKSSGSFTFIYGSGKAMSALEMERFFVNNASVVHPGTHMRCKYGSHSITIMAIDYANGTVTYIDCNNEGTCKVRDFTTITWSEFAKRFSTINYITVYKNYYSYYSGAPDPALIAQIQNRLPKPTPTKRPATPTPSPSPADYPIGLYKVTAEPHLNLREDTYTSSNKISELETGREVEIFQFAYNKGGHHWGLIDTEEGSGWSSMGYLTLIAEYTPTPTPTYIPADFEAGTYTVTASSLMIREKQTTNSDSLGKLTKDTVVQMMVFVMGDNGSNWGYVSVEDSKVQGWVSMDYMEIIPTETPSPTPSPTDTPSPTPTEEPAVVEKTPTPWPSITPTNSPTPSSGGENGEGKLSDTTITVISIILVCIAGEALLFIFLKKRRDHIWEKRGADLDNKQTSEKIKFKFKKKD